MMKINTDTVKENLIIGIFYSLVYISALLLADFGHGMTAFFILAVSAVAFCIIRIYKRACLVDSGAMLIMFWTLGLALAIMRLSSLHTPWTLQTKISFLLLPVGFLIGECIEPAPVRKQRRQHYVFSCERLFYLIPAVSIVSALFFLMEAVILGYVPAFSKDTHAYNYFHVTGLHYFTVSCMMTHALTAVYLQYVKKVKRKLEKKQKAVLIGANVISLLVALMCVSKLQFILIIGLPLIILLGQRVDDFKRLPWRRIVAVLVGIAIAFLAVMMIFTRLRHYEPGYLDSIFEFRNKKAPGWFQYIYMYIANNYANFNCMTERLTVHSYGLRQLFPVFALTGTKFVFPQLIYFPLFVVKEEINTLTLIYDAYYDFGIVGVLGFSVILGIVSCLLSKKRDEGDNPVFMLFFAQFTLYMVLSFFSAWFSVATTWFWFALTAVFCMIVMKKEDSNE